MRITDLSCDVTLASFTLIFSKSLSFLRISCYACACDCMQTAFVWSVQYLIMKKERSLRVHVCVYIYLVMRLGIGQLCLDLLQFVLACIQSRCQRLDCFLVETIDTPTFNNNKHSSHDNKMRIFCKCRIMCITRFWRGAHPFLGQPVPTCP